MVSRIIPFILLLGLAVSVQCYASEPLPQPLSLYQALSYSEKHPYVQKARSMFDFAQAEADLVTTDSALKISAEGYLTAIEPAGRSLNRDNNDSKIFLRARKRLYDFGYSSARESAAEHDLKSSQWLFLDQHQDYRLDIAEKFFNVLIADKDYTLKDETMTVAFLRYDKARDRHELGQVSDIDLLQLEDDYRKKLQIRKLAEVQQRLTRQKLATALGRVNDLPADLVMPAVDWKKPLPALDRVIERALADNLKLRKARNGVEAAKQKLQVAQSADNPVIHGEVVLADYNRETNSTHPASAGLVLEIPLYTGGANQAETAKARAQLAEQEANLQLLESTVHEAAVELLLQLEALQADLEAQQINAEFTELYLDKNRALYELEVASDYGDATVQVSQMILNNTRTLLQYALAEARLAALQGEWQWEKQ